MSTATHIPTDDLGALGRYAQTGDPRAFEVLVRRYQGMVLATCLRTINRRDDAEDAAQETFLKLARAAAAVRSNVAAWLHGCAVRTSIDLVRKRGSQVRAEAAAAGLKTDEETRQHAEPPAWSEIRPILDSAIAALSEEDRALIVERFLAGRPEIEMATDAKVTPGTMNRRIDRALDRLRIKLAAAGLGASGAIAAGGLALSELLTSAGPAPVKPMLTVSLMEVGLAGMPACGVAAAGAASGTITKLVAGLALLSVATVGGVAAWRWAGAGAAMTSALPAGSFPRPTKADGPYAVVSMTVDGKAPSRVTCEGRRIRFEKTAGSDRGSGMTLRIDTVVKQEPATGEWKGGTFTTLQATMLDCNVPDAGPFSALVGKTLEGRVRLRGDMMEFELEYKEPTGFPGMFRWLGRSLASSGEKPNTAPTEETPAPGLVGAWEEVQPLDLTIDADEIRFRGGDQDVVRFKILEWEEAGEGVAKVSTLCVRHMMEAPLIGTRMKLLIRKDAGGITIAMHDAASKKRSDLPSGFEPKDGDAVRVVRCREGKR